MALTEAAIRNAKPGTKFRKRLDAGDLCLLITQKGGCWWRLDVRYAGARESLSLGDYPEVSGHQPAQDVGAVDDPHQPLGGVHHGDELLLTAQHGDQRLSQRG